MPEKIRNWLLGGGLVLVWAMTLGFLDWRASVHATKAITESSMVDPSKVKANEESIKDLEKADDKLYDKIERIVDILLED